MNVYPDLSDGIRERMLRELDLVLDQLDFGEDIDWVEDLPTDFEHLWLLRSMSMRLSAAVAVLRERIETAMAYDLGEGGRARFGDEFVQYSKPNDYVLNDGGRDWLPTLSTADVLAVLPKPSKFRKTGLEAVAERHGLPADALEGTFYTNRRDDKEPTIQVMPLSRAPKYASKMEYGEIRRKKAKTE